MKKINKYTDLKTILIGDEVDNRKGKKGIVIDIVKTSVAWGIQYDFKLRNGLTITIIN